MRTSFFLFQMLFDPSTRIHPIKYCIRNIGKNLKAILTLFALAEN